MKKEINMPSTTMYFAHHESTSQGFLYASVEPVEIIRKTSKHVFLVGVAGRERREEITTAQYSYWDTKELALARVNRFLDNEIEKTRIYAHLLNKKKEELA